MFVSVRSIKSEATDMSCSFCSAVSSRGTDFADTRLMPKSVVKIPLHAPQEILCTSAIHQMVGLRYALTKSCTFAVTSPFLFDEVLPDRSSLSVANLRMCSDLLTQQNVVFFNTRFIISVFNTTKYNQ
jgi:hypothetical protein